MLCTQIVLNVKTKTKNQFVNKKCSESVLSLEFSCTELVIQWTIFCHIVGFDARISTSEKIYL